jgi:hypothetical protein
MLRVVTISARSTIRGLAWLLAGCLVAGTALFLARDLNLFNTPPVIPDTADLPTRLLASMDFERAQFPLDAISNLLFAVAFAIFIPLGRFLGRAGAADWRSEIMSNAIFAAGVIGLAAQLIYVGSKQVVISIGYCDCGFKTTEVISQNWALMLIQGAQGWLLNGGLVLLAIGIAAARLVLGGRVLPGGWQALSWLVAAGLLATSVLRATDLIGDKSDALLLVFVGVLLPVWTIWLGQGVAAVESAGGTAS